MWSSRQVITAAHILGNGRARTIYPGPITPKNAFSKRVLFHDIVDKPNCIEPAVQLHGTSCRRTSTVLGVKALGKITGELGYGCRRPGVMDLSSQLGYT